MPSSKGRGQAVRLPDVKPPCLTCRAFGPGIFLCVQADWPWAEAPDVHTIKANFSATGAAQIVQRPYVPVLELESVIRVDTTRLDEVDVASVADSVRNRLTSG